jgi:hypothetical protein
MTQQTLILKKLAEAKGWVYSYDLVKVWIDGHFLGTSGDREARRLAEDGVIERNNDEKYARYRLKNLQVLKF